MYSIFNKNSKFEVVYQARVAAQATPIKHLKQTHEVGVNIRKMI